MPATRTHRLKPHEERCEYLVTGDKGLQELGEYKGMKIVSPGQFVEILAQQAS
jgi:predicted nucleic acid-binding protein